GRRSDRRMKRPTGSVASPGARLRPTPPRCKPIRKAKEAEPPWRLLVCERGAARSRAPLGFELLAHLLIGDLRILDFVDERLSRHHSQVSMFPSVVCDFEQRIGHQLLRAFAVREHPLAAHEKRGLMRFARRKSTMPP